MPRPESTQTAHALYPALAMTAVAAFLMRARLMTITTSPGSGVTIAGSEMLMRSWTLAHAAIGMGERAFSFLFRIALAPPLFAMQTMQSEFHFAAGAAGRIVAVLHLAATHLLQSF